MNFLTINIRGVRDPNKARWIKGIKKNHKVKFMCFQETKSHDLDIRHVNREEMDFDIVNPSGKWGLLCVWTRLFSQNQLL